MHSLTRLYLTSRSCDHVVGMETKSCNLLLPLPFLLPHPFPLRAAMEKMQTIYTDNPKLGDPNTVAQSLDICQRRIEELGAELEKFKVSSLDDNFPCPLYSLI